MKEVLKKTEERMGRRIEHLQGEYAAIRAGRANPAVLDKIMVDYYGTPTPVNQLAAVSVTEARTLMVQPWDTSVLKEVERAIQMSDLGINPQNDGKGLRIVFPPLTEDRRKEIGKEIKEIAEETKVGIRNIRRDSVEKFKTMKKNGDLTEDELKQSEKKTQDLTDKFIKEVDAMSEKKKTEIMEI